MGQQVVDVAVTALVYLGIRPDPAWKLDGQAVGLLPERVAAARVPTERASGSPALARESGLGSGATQTRPGALSDFDYRGPDVDPHDGWVTPMSNRRGVSVWSYAVGRDGAPGRLNVHGPAGRLNWMRTSVNPAFTGDLTKHGADRLRVSAYYFDATPGNNLHDIHLQLVAQADGSEAATSWTIAAPGSIDFVYDRARKYHWSHVDFGVIDANWTDAEAQRAGWKFDDRGDRHVPFADTVRSVGTFALSTNGSDTDDDVGYFDDVRIDPIREPESLPKLVQP